MATTLIVGDGPGGLSAALLLAKNGMDTVVYGKDDTPMHHAQLWNYLGVPEIRGSDFQAVARAQVTEAKAELREAHVEAVGVEGDRFVVSTDRDRATGDYLVLAGGKQAQRLAGMVGVTAVDGRIPVDGDARTEVDRVYVVGRATRPARSQAIISAGAGAAAALDILSREAGRDVHDWDTPPEHDHDHPHL